uniref:BTB domain-containing protein n=1 Tax=Pristionchus pacificus TaxID=54126 RepID=A0A2A6CC75_PRIPA|eukprot:PDM75825.1 BTB domain-containing protein [Pristionchus pacificus]
MKERMADDSKTILRWEIDNTTEKFATGKVESEIFDKGGFTWTMSAEKDAYRDGKTNFTLRCGADHNGAWRCETEVEVREYQENGINFDVACTEGWISDNKVVLEYHINITNAESKFCGDLIADPSMFAAPNRMSNVILRIGDKKIHVSKEYLSVHSPAFEALFFGDFAEKGKEEVEIKDVVYESLFTETSQRKEKKKWIFFGEFSEKGKTEVELRCHREKAQVRVKLSDFKEFIDLLHLMYLKTMKITDRTVLYILKLSDRFQIESVLNQAILHLSDSKKFDVMAKLLIADQYNLAELKVKCLNSFVNVVELHEKMLTSPEYDKFSSDMKAAICDRIMKLKMTDDSKIVLRWEIDDAQAKFATGRVESKVFDQGGFKWIIIAGKDADRDDETDIVLKCVAGNDEEWKCEADVEIRHFWSNGTTFDVECNEQRLCFNPNNTIWIHECKWAWSVMTDWFYSGATDKSILEFHITIFNSERGELISDQSMFAAPNEMSNVILKIGDVKLHVSKELLSIHSPVFKTMFFGDLAEKGRKEEVEINDVNYEDFLDLLYWIYHKTMITDRSVLHILKLADHFQMKDIFKEAELYITQSKGFDVMAKLLVADQFNLVDLKEQCFQSFTGVLELHEKIQKFPEYDKFSGEMKIAICDKIRNLKQQMTDDSTIVLRWEIDNLVAKFATGRVESETAIADKYDLDGMYGARFALKCDAGRNGAWKCEADIELRQYLNDNINFTEECKDERFCFTANSDIWELQCDWVWFRMSYWDYTNNDKIILEFHITLIASDSGHLIADPTMFTAPNRRSNVILKIGDEKIHVSKEFLAVHSSVFETIFFGEFAENGKDEVELKDVVYEEFFDLLHLLYFGTIKITDRTVLHILKLSDRFQMERVLDQAKMYLTQSNGFDVMAKLLVADQYNLTDLKDECLKSFTTASVLRKKLKEFPDYDKLSADMKAAICDRNVKLPTIIAKKHGDGCSNFALKCDAGHNGEWKCETKVEVRQYKKNGINFHVACSEEPFCFNREGEIWKCEHYWNWADIATPGYIIDGKIVFEFRIDILSSERGELFGDPGMLVAPNKMSNVILKIGDKKLHVSKELLAIHSPVFETLFFWRFCRERKGRSGDKGCYCSGVEFSYLSRPSPLSFRIASEKVLLMESDLLLKEFLDLLNVIHLKMLRITDRNVVHILKLADRFQMKDVLKLAKMCLIESKGIEVMSKLLIAEQYNLADLKVFPEYDKITDNLKIAICNRMKELNLLYHHFVRVFVCRMTDDSKIILRWEIDNAAARFATGKVESEVFDKGGFKWNMIAEKDANSDDGAIFTLRCDADYNGSWKSDVEIKVRQYKKNGVDYGSLTNMTYDINGKAVLEFRIKIISSERLFFQSVMFHYYDIDKLLCDELFESSCKFDASNEMSNVILKIGDKRLHVSKELLSVHSPVYKAMFFGDYVEKGQEEVELKDIVYEEFLDLLNLIYLRTMLIKDRTVVHILKLADQFQIKEHCLKSFTNATELHKKLQKAPEYGKFSENMKAAICDRIMELNLQMTDDSQIVLRWEIDNATEKFATGIVESEAFVKGGFRWLPYFNLQLLSIHSPVFKTLFFGDFVEEGKEEVELKDVVYEEFLDLLHIIYLGKFKITNRTVGHLLKLADRFQMERVLDHATIHLIQSKGIDVMAKRLLADQYNRAYLKVQSFLILKVYIYFLTQNINKCLMTFNDDTKLLRKMQASPEYDKFSADMKAAICDRMMKLKPQMTDESKFDLRWDIDDAKAKFSAERVESSACKGGGFQWTIALERRVDASGNPLNDTVDFSVHAAIDPKLGGKRLWKCEAEFIICLTKQNGKIYAFRSQDLFSFNESKSTYVYASNFLWNSLSHPVYIVQGMLTMQFLVTIKSSESEEISDSAKFAAPTNRSNVVLLLLSIHSPVFETLFFGDFIEKGKEEVEIKDVVFEEFLDLLHLIYPGTMTITDRTVLHILKLSHLFQIEHLLTQSLHHLTTTEGIDVVHKLIAADLYCDLCLKSFGSVEEITQQIKSSQEYDHFSGGMKFATSDALTQQSTPSTRFPCPSLTMSRLSHLLVLAMVAFVAADNVAAADEIELFEADDNQLFDPNEYPEYNLDITHMEEVTPNTKLQLLKSSHVCPPNRHTGVPCPESGLFFYYKCCGEKNKACCRERQHAIFLLLVIVIVVLSICFGACCK